MYSASYQVIKSIIHFYKPQAYNLDNKLSGHIINFYPRDSYRVRFALRYFTHILQNKNARRYLRACNIAIQQFRANAQFMPF